MLSVTKNIALIFLQVTSESTKNHPGTAREEFEPEGGRIYETRTPSCPVFSFERYMSKLNPNCDALWQRPKDSFLPSDDIWYENKPLGKNTLSQIGRAHV